MANMAETDTKNYVGSVVLCTCQVSPDNIRFLWCYSLNTLFPLKIWKKRTQNPSWYTIFSVRKQMHMCQGTVWLCGCQTLSGVMKCPYFCSPNSAKWWSQITQYEYLFQYTTLTYLVQGPFTMCDKAISRPLWTFLPISRTTQTSRI